MKTFAALITSVPDIVERRQPYREVHLAGLRKLKEEGKLVMAGAWADQVDGALIIFKADSKEEVEQILRNDPYYKAGLWPEFRVREWGIAVS